MSKNRSMHACPDCRCGQISLTWSNRQTWVFPDLNEISSIVVACAMDHVYDRPADCIPYEFHEDARKALIPVVSKHMEIANPCWKTQTVQMSDEAMVSFKYDVRDVLEKCERVV